LPERPVIDCDVHCAPATMAELEPYLSDYWREYVRASELRLIGMANAYPPNAPTSATLEAREGPGPAVPATFEQLAERVLDRFEPRYAILNCLTICEAYRNPYFQLAMAQALNNWLRAEWLDRDERLRASIVVPLADPEGAVTEIERLADDGRFLQVLLPIRVDAPYGNKRYHPVYAAAVASGKAIGLHAWGMVGHAPSTTGYTLSYMEDYLGNVQTVQAHVMSLVSEGVFERFPGLRVSLMECGFAWLPPLLWRFDKDWKGVWQEVPWVKEKPSTYVKRHFRATTQPTHGPQDRNEIRQVLEMIGTEWLMHSSDYPHDHGPAADALYDALDADETNAVLHDNAATFYQLDG
jgi:predicted TIM-barrel fold metal-dependent hydrolase